MFFLKFVASILLLRPSVWKTPSASLVAVVLGLVSESYNKSKHLLEDVMRSKENVILTE